MVMVNQSTSLALSPYLFDAFILGPWATLPLGLTYTTNDNPVRFGRRFVIKKRLLLFFGMVSVASAVPTRSKVKLCKLAAQLLHFTLTFLALRSIPLVTTHREPQAVRRVTVSQLLFSEELQEPPVDKAEWPCRLDRASVYDT